MKSKYIFLFLLVFIVSFFAYELYVNSLNKKDKELFNDGKLLYFVVIDVSPNKTDSDFLLEFKKNKYYLYGGITSNLKDAEKLKDIYKKNYNNTFIEKEYITNKQFITLLLEFEKIFSIASNEDKIKIQKIVLSNYKEMVLYSNND